MFVERWRAPIGWQWRIWAEDTTGAHWAPCLIATGWVLRERSTDKAADRAWRAYIRREAAS